MKSHATRNLFRCFFVLTLALGMVCLHLSPVFSQEDAESPGDPTKANAEMEEVLRALRSEDEATASARPETRREEQIFLAGLVVGGRQDPETASGSVIFRVGDNYVLAREGQSFENGAENYLVKTANSVLVLLEKGSGEELVLRAQNSSISGGGARDLALVELQEVPLYLAARALSDETGIRIAVSSQARSTPISLYLQGVTVPEALDSIVLTHRLYMSQIPEADIVRLHTTEEYAEDANAFRDERTQVFTLKYPNARDVAVSIADLYGDRVQLAERLGQGEDPNEYLSEDLQQRLDRFDVIDGRAQGFGVDSAGGGGGAAGGRSLSSTSSSGLNSRNSRSFSGGGGRTQQGTGDRFDRLSAEEGELSAEQIAALASGDAAMIEQVLRNRADIYVTVIDRLNKVMVRTRDEKTMKEICELIISLDVPTPLVLLEVKIMEVTLERGLDTAFDWNFNSGNWNGTFSPLGPADPGDLVFTYLDTSFQSQIDLLQRGNKLTILGKPMLLTANNEVSRLFIGEEVPLNRNFGGGQEFIDNGTIITGAATTDIEFRPVGSTLLITPNINEDRTVSLRVLQEESRVLEDGAEILVPNAAGGFTNQSIDIVSSQTASGTFVARDRETIAIGGMITETLTSTRSQIPILGDIPGVGILARNQRLGRERSEIVLLLTPHIIKTPGEGEPITRQLMEEDSYHPNAPLGEGELGAFVRPNVLTTGSEEYGPLEKIQEEQILRAQPVHGQDKNPKGLKKFWPFKKSQ